MAIWYATIRVTDKFDAKGNIEYPAGAVSSYGTQLLSAEDADKIGVRQVDLGDWPESGIPWTKMFDLSTETIVDRPPEAKEGQALHDSALWTDLDRDAAMKMIMKRLNLAD